MKWSLISCLCRTDQHRNTYQYCPIKDVQNTNMLYETCLYDVTHCKIHGTSLYSTTMKFLFCNGWTEHTANETKHWQRSWQNGKEDSNADNILKASIMNRTLINTSISNIACLLLLWYSNRFHIEQRKYSTYFIIQQCLSFIQSNCLKCAKCMQKIEIASIVVAYLMWRGAFLRIKI